VSAFELVPDAEPDVDRSAALLRDHEPPGGYYGCFSGGKDSVALKELARIAGVEVVWHYNQTTIDPPELVRFIRREHSDVRWLKPKHGNFFRRMEAKGHVPTRGTRWCCSEYKERPTPKGTVLMMGIRAEESAIRAKHWKPVGVHARSRRKSVLPIIDWDSEFLWDFIRLSAVPYCELYDEGFTRLGCVGCPMHPESRRIEFARWPGFERQWHRSIARIWEAKTGTLQRDGREWFGSACFAGVEQFWQWWLRGRDLPNGNQLEFAAMTDGARR
jgi:phosphoadenosine phosphosulfate reductase